MQIWVAQIDESVARNTQDVDIVLRRDDLKTAMRVLEAAGFVYHEAAGVTIEVLNQRPVAADALLPGSGTGLAGLRERVTLVGGDLEAGPTTAGGWRVGAWLPWPPGTPSGALVSHLSGEP